ncbi:MAG TPA: HEPN domain-containing protein [Edaphocola sp.]|nr:HEPN domain-containing protein [Edaphocola sp.]
MKLFQKSEFNADASEELIKSYLYAPSVHCSYYSVFQLMKYLMNTFCGINYEDIDVFVRNNKTSEHRYIQRQILNEINNADRENYQRIKREVDDLFQFRVYSDYKNVEILHDQAEKAFKYSQELRNYLKTKMIK